VTTVEHDLLPVEDYVRRCTVTRVIDGDTVDLTVDLGWHTQTGIRLRLEGIDTPELRPRRDRFATEPERQAHIDAAQDAAAFVMAWVNTFDLPELGRYPLYVESTSLDRHAGAFGRSLGDLVTPDGLRLTDSLLNAGHAERTEP
jgi:endonuclease YncB( thermonuclease family)